MLELGLILLVWTLVGMLWGALGMMLASILRPFPMPPPGIGKYKGQPPPGGERDLER